MKLETYLEIENIKPFAFSKKLKGIHWTTLYKWLNGQRPSYKNARLIELATEGKVTIADMLT